MTLFDLANRCDLGLVEGSVSAGCCLAMIDLGNRMRDRPIDRSIEHVVDLNNRTCDRPVSPINMSPLVTLG